MNRESLVFIRRTTIVRFKFEPHRPSFDLEDYKGLIWEFWTIMVWFEIWWAANVIYKFVIIWSYNFKFHRLQKCDLNLVDMKTTTWIWVIWRFDLKFNRLWRLDLKFNRPQRFDLEFEGSRGPNLKFKRPWRPSFKLWKT